MMNRDRVRDWVRRAAWVALPVVVIGLAVTRPGYPVDAIELSDASVWITNLSNSERKVARYNQPIEELTGGFTITPSEGRFDVMQAGENVAISQARDYRVVDPAGLSLSEPAALPQPEADQPDFPRLAVGGQTVLLVNADATQAWVRPFSLAAHLDAEADKPDFALDHGRAVVAPDGTVWAVTGEGRVIRAVLSNGDVKPKVEQIGQIASASAAALAAASTSTSTSTSGQLSAVSAVGQRVYVLAGTTLSWLDGSVDLARYGEAETLKLQTPGAQSDYVGVAGPRSLLLIDKRGRVTELLTGNEGDPAVPAGQGDCVHAAWAAAPEDGSNYIAACGGDLTAERALQSISPGAELVFRVNRQVIVLNDVTDGRVWMPDQDNKVRDKLNWDQIDPQDQDKSNQNEDVSQDQQLDCTDKSAKPQAVDDEYGVRPGSSAILMVLSNDAATSCGALAIDRIDGLDPDQGTAEPVLAGRAIQFTPVGEAGSASFVYTISDANGQTSSASVTVSLADAVNHAPQPPPGPLRLSIELGASATYSALTGFTDPEGDPIELASAVSDDPAILLSYRPNGTVTIKDNGGGARNSVQVMLSVRDSFGAQAAAVPLNVSFVAAGALVPEVSPAKGEAFVGQAVTVNLRETLRTAHLDAPSFALDGQPPPLTMVEIDAATGVLTFAASAANCYLLPVTVTAGGNSAHLAVRIDVKDVRTPRVVAVQDTAYLRPNVSTVIDPLLNDLAEGGGVMVLRSFDTSRAPGVEVVPVGHQFLELFNNGGSGAELIGYTVSVDGVIAEGVIRVVHSDAGANQDPVVSPMRLKVRAGGVVTIPVLDQTFDPDGDMVAIDTSAPFEPVPACGKVYASGRAVRFQAPEAGCPKPVVVSVPVADDAGGTGLGTFTIEVHHSQGSSKAPPEPRDLTARVLQGEEVRIPVPLTGIDVDGDGVSLQQGLDTQPSQGTITEVGPDYIKYRASEDQSPGTDSFTYAVEDWASNRATATVSVGVSTKGASASGVVARDDSATAKPFKVLDIPVLSNDVDLSGRDDLSLCQDQPLGLSDPRLVAEPNPQTRRLSVTLPGDPGLYQIVYFACGASGNRDSATVHLVVDPEAPVAPPRAKDIVSPPQETIDKESVDIDVMHWAYNPSGPSSDLELFLPPESDAHAKRMSQTEITVQLRQELPTIVFYGLRNTSPEAEGAVSYGSITVPPISRPPYRRPDLEPVRTEAGQEVIIKLDEHIAVAKGREGAFLYQPGEAGNLTAAHGVVKAVEAGRAVSYTAPRRYSGTDRIEFWVADTANPADKTLKRSKLWLDVVVTPKGQARLTYQDPAPQVERGGGVRSFDLADFVRADGQPLNPAASFTADLGKSPLGGVGVTQVGSRVTISADTTVQVGDRITLPLTIAYDDGDPKAGLGLTVSVIETKQPAVKPKVISPVKAEKGVSQLVPVLQGVFDPWAASHPAEISAISVVGDASAQALGQSVEVTANATNQDVLVSFVVEDALGRLQAGSFTVIARSRPDAPASVAAEPGDKSKLAVTWAPVTGNHENGEKVDRYRVSLPGVVGAVCPDAIAPATTVICDMGAAKYGQRLQADVVAHNLLGDSDPGRATFDYERVPDAPTAEAADAALYAVALRWAAPPADGGTVASYNVACGGVRTQATASSTSQVVSGLTAGTTYNCTVAAVNTKGASVEAAFPPVTPYGQPGRLNSPLVERISDSILRVTWVPVADHGADLSYELFRDDQPTGCTAAPCTFGITPGAVTHFQLKATSPRIGVTAVESDLAGPYTQWPSVLPSGGVITAVSGSAAPNAADGVIDLTWPTPPALTGHATTTTYRVGSAPVAGPPAALTGLTAGLYSFSAEFCYWPTAGSWMPPAPSGLCSTLVSTSFTVTTKPGGPAGCQADRISDSEVSLSGCHLVDTGGLTSQLQYFETGSAVWQDLPDPVVIDLPVGLTAGSFTVRASNSLGSSPVVNVDYPAYTAPSQTPTPPVSPSPSPSASTSTGTSVSAGQARHVAATDQQMRKIWTPVKPQCSPASSPPSTAPSRAPFWAKPALLDWF
ncbi:MAG: fibronectin type III domain-containing protein [Bifidobacteriaceae bacterium]|jgi:hypothetical protein|nr:fibronectin type III domain-containing protein [Bifidobacteriaceae bacterium]